MRNTRLLIGGVSSIALVLLNLAACSSTPTDPSAVTAQALEEREGDHADHEDGDEIGGDDDGDRGFVRPRAQQGLKIAPVALDLTGKSDEEVEQIGLGSYIINAAGTCNDCHTWQKNGHMAGGRPFVVAPGITVTSRNLTPDPVTGMGLTESQFIESVRTGKDFHSADPTQLLVMPWVLYRWMSTGDLKAMYAYLKALPAISQKVPADVKPLRAPIPFPKRYTDGDVNRRLPRHSGRSNWARGIAIDPLDTRDLDDSKRAFGRGSYLVNSQGDCTSCHTWNRWANSTSLFLPPEFKNNTVSFLSGGRTFVPPPPVAAALHEARAQSSNLTGATNGFFHEAASTFDRFEAVIRTGTHADETPPRPLAFPMPASTFAKLLDDDLFAIYTYISTIPARTGGADKQISDYARWCAKDADCRTGESCFASPGHLNECVGAACVADSDCDVCQTCRSGASAAPDASSTCPTIGHTYP